MRIPVARLWWQCLALSCLLTVGCSAPPHAPELDYSRKTLDHEFGAERRQTAGHLPYLGLALAGGGTKASGFSIGVLKGLVESGQMEQVDIISSVSGGSYAAYWYYARLVFDDPTFGLDQPTSSTFRQALFLDCFPSRYMKTLGVTWPSSDPWLAGQPIPCPPQNNTNLLKIAAEDKFKDDAQRQETQHQYDLRLAALDRPELGKDPYRAQNALRGYQDIFSTGRNFFGAHAFDYNTTEDDQRFANETLEMVPLEVGSIVLNAFANIAFDWNINVSSTQRAYAKGIERTYGASAPNCDEHDNACITSMYGTSIRLEGDIEQAKSLSYAQIQRAFEVKGAPLWIINATAGEDRSAFDVGEQLPFYLSAFEVSPYHYGSGLYGYWPGHLADLTPAKAVLSSAAFLDSQQKVEAEPPLRNLYNAGQKIAALDWGLSFPNPNNSSDIIYGSHYLLPFPLYHVDRLDDAKHSTFIHLSDGGMSENLGAYALVRRGVSNLIISDHAQDREGWMADICRLRDGLDKQGLTLLLPGLSSLDRQCKIVKYELTGYDIYAWEHPVLVGCIVSKALASSNCEKLPVNLSKDQYAAHLFVIKPALGTKSMQTQLQSINKACTQGSKEKCQRFVRQACTTPNGTNDSPMWQGAPAPSCEVYAFISKNFNNSAGIASDGCPNFPQFGTVALTADSSPWIYGAMRDLAAYYTTRVSWFFAQGGLINEDHFLEELRYQRRNAMPLLVDAKLRKPGAKRTCDFKAPRQTTKST
ncbi:patatin-like phospholipase family protein [Pseudomonas frederiksbergensis]|nr:patatin-like phospholipase family protein [Pseudomonas frederiksbergensis]